MNRLRSLLALDQPQETRFFLVIAVFGIVIGIIYWFVAYEEAGTVLLLGFGGAAGVIGLRLLVAPQGARVRRAVHQRSEGHPAADVSLDRKDVTGAGAGGIDRPFLDERGRIPSPTLAPFALGLGLSVMLTGVIFGPGPIVAGLVPFAWGAWTWLRGAEHEFDAVERTSLAAEAGADEPPEASPAPAGERVGIPR